MRKQLIAVVCAGLILLSLSSCSSESDEVKSTGLYVEQNGQMVELSENFVKLRDSMSDTTIVESTVMDTASVEIDALGCSYDEQTRELVLRFRGSNFSDKRLIVESNGVYINNCLVEGHCYREISGGQTNEFTVKVSLYELSALGFCSFEAVDVSFRVKDSESNSVIEESAYVRINMSSYDDELPVATFNEDVVHLSSETSGFSADVQSRYTSNDFFYGNSIQALVSNPSEFTSVEMVDLRVNNVDMPVTQFVLIEAGKQGVVMLPLHESYLKEAKIDDVRSVEATLRLVGETATLTQTLSFVVD